MAVRATSELEHRDAATPLVLEALGLEIVAQGVRDAGRSPVEGSWLERVRGALEPVPGVASPSLAELASVVDRHPVYVARAFRAKFGCSVGEYSRRRRIAWCCDQLASSKREIVEIATEAGFHDQSHMSRLFRRYMGTSPAAFRAAHTRRQANRTPQVRCR